MEEKDNHHPELMARRIRRILLVCNNYDSYSLEEDGHIEAQIAQDYAELNLSNPPDIIRVETTVEALDPQVYHQRSRYHCLRHSLHPETELVK